MESLNPIIQRSIEVSLIKAKGIAVEFDLCPDMPELYEDFAIGTPLFKALSNLNGELEDLKPKKVLFRTSYENNTQKLCISHNGRQLSQQDLYTLNSLLNDIYEGRKQWTPYRHGNLIAGQAIKSYEGRIRLENIDENGYKVRTTLEIPARTP